MNRHSLCKRMYRQIYIQLDSHLREFTNRSALEFTVHFPFCVLRYLLCYTFPLSSVCFVYLFFFFDVVDTRARATSEVEKEREMPLPEQLFWRGRRLNYVRKAGELSDAWNRLPNDDGYYDYLNERRQTRSPYFFFLSWHRNAGLFHCFLVYSLYRLFPSQGNVYTGTRCVISFEATHTLPLNQEFFSPCCCFSLSFPSSFLYIHIYLYIYMGASAVQAMDCWAVRIALDATHYFQLGAPRRGVEINNNSLCVQWWWANVCKHRNTTAHKSTI